MSLGSGLELLIGTKAGAAYEVPLQLSVVPGDPTLVNRTIPASLELAPGTRATIRLRGQTAWAAASDGGEKGWDHRFGRDSGVGAHSGAMATRHSPGHEQRRRGNERAGTGVHDKGRGNGDHRAAARAFGRCSDGNERWCHSGRDGSDRAAARRSYCQYERRDDGGRPSQYYARETVKNVPQAGWRVEVDLDRWRQPPSVSNGISAARRLAGLGRNGTPIPRLRLNERERDPAPPAPRGCVICAVRRSDGRHSRRASIKTPPRTGGPLTPGYAC